MSDGTCDGLRTLLIGIDGASHEVLAERGESVVPNLTALLDRGSSGALESQIPPWTPSAWPSLYTGVNPGKHGVYGFLAFEGYDWDVVDYADVKAHALWELLSERGFTSVVVNVPVTHPPTAFDGALVPGYTSPESPTCHPSGLLADLEAELGDYRVYDDSTDPSDDRAERIESYERLLASRGEAFRYLADRFDPDFGFLQFQQTDTVFHESPEDDRVVDAVYAAADREIGATIEACDPDVVLVASDHGIGPYDGHEFRANSFLRDRGDVATTVGEGGMPSWTSIARNRLQGDPAGGAGDADGSADASGNSAANGTAGATALERSLAVAARVGVTSQRIERVVKRLGIEDLVLRIAPADAVRAAAEQVDFPASRAYVRDRIELGVRINLEGREPEGVVPPAEYDAVRSELVDALSAVETPDGEPVFEAVRPREAVFDGPYLEDAPDVVVVPNEFDQFLSASLHDEQFGPPSEPWNHKLDGLIAVAGDVDTSVSLADRFRATADGSRTAADSPAAGDGSPTGDTHREAAHLFDVAPTVLATFGLPAAERMDGDVLPVVEPAGVERYPDYDPAADGPAGAPAATEESAVEDRLADLGYLER
ncbi:hypothetical protein L593_08025 [Salinarchaeum sp. Harcht-Bsk1]|uniref:alkaline phosphatase family protein n=1 Tax=Salinarchaeum sp. Harcht-Bsk1 TaxID=1333523 RepID=UPI00034234A9|nr:alkaline phosphatase family protein [Salinarchaeum sp. Harcht-Bsk1]AGN01550.1 hypothetical protein L593_08025 [Salinarchaeum sp. Harcht-Bsk1]